MNTAAKTIRGPRVVLDGWIERLIKNDLPQGKGQLHNAEPDSLSYGYCCLGVLEVAANGETEINGITPSPTWLKRNGVEFAVIRNGLPLFHSECTSPSVFYMNRWQSVWVLNDTDRLTFPEIGELLKNHIEYTD